MSTSLVLPFCLRWISPRKLSHRAWQTCHARGDSRFHNYPQTNHQSISLRLVHVAHRWPKNLDRSFHRRARAFLTHALCYLTNSRCNSYHQDRSCDRSHCVHCVPSIHHSASHPATPSYLSHASVIQSNGQCTGLDLRPLFVNVSLYVHPSLLTSFRFSHLHIRIHQACVVFVQLLDCSRNWLRCEAVNDQLS